MKWEQYNKMTREHKEEYDFRFKRDKLEWPIDWYVVFFIKSIVVAELALILSIHTAPALSDLQKYSESMLTYSVLLLGVIAWVLLTQILAWIGDIALYEYRQHKWLKERGYK